MRGSSDSVVFRDTQSLLEKPTVLPCRGAISPVPCVGQGCDSVAAHWSAAGGLNLVPLPLFIVCDLAPAALILCAPAK